MPPGRPRITQRTEEAIVRLYLEHPGWTYEMIARAAPSYRIKGTGKRRYVSAPTVIRILKKANVWKRRRAEV